MLYVPLILLYLHEDILMKKISILFFVLFFTLSAMDRDCQEAHLKKFKSCKHLDFQEEHTQEERGEADQKKLRLSLSDPKELVQEVYSSKTERGEAEYKKARFTPERSIESLLVEANEQYDTKPEQAIELFEEALPLCQNINQLYSTNFKLGFLYGFRMPKSSKHATAACNYFSNALAVVKSIELNNDPAVCNNARGTVLRLLSVIHLEQLDRKQAVICGKEALRYEKRPLYRALIYQHLGTSLRPINQLKSCKQFQSGINTLLDMIKERAEKKEWIIKGNIEISNIYGNLLKEIANTYFIYMCIDEAQAHYEKALNFVTSSESKGTICVQLGLIYHKKAKIHRARNEHECAKGFAQSAQLCFEKATQEEVKNCNKASYNLAKSLLQRLNLATL